MTPQESLEQDLGKELPIARSFASDETFGAINEARQFCTERGFSVGSMQADAPMGIKRGNYAIAKWRNLSHKDRKMMDGAIIGQDKRNGPVTVVYCEEEK